MGGPIGAVIGAAIGAVAGGLAGKGVAEVVDPTAEDAYWRENYTTRSYVEPGSSYDDYQPAYRYGWESRTQHHGKAFNEVEADLERGWNSTKSTANMSWERAKHATRDAWDRVERDIPGDADRDGK